MESKAVAATSNVAAAKVERTYGAIKVAYANLVRHLPPTLDGSITTMLQQSPIRTDTGKSIPINTQVVYVATVLYLCPFGVISIEQNRPQNPQNIGSWYELQTACEVFLSRTRIPQSTSLFASDNVKHQEFVDALQDVYRVLSAMAYNQTNLSEARRAQPLDLSQNVTGAAMQAFERKITQCERRHEERVSGLEQQLKPLRDDYKTLAAQVMTDREATKREIQEIQSALNVHVQAHETTTTQQIKDAVKRLEALIPNSIPNEAAPEETKQLQTRIAGLDLRVDGIEKELKRYDDTFGSFEDTEYANLATFLHNDNMSRVSQLTENVPNIIAELRRRLDTLEKAASAKRAQPEEEVKGTPNQGAPDGNVVRTLVQDEVNRVMQDIKTCKHNGDMQKSLGTLTKRVTILQKDHEDLQKLVAELANTRTYSTTSKALMSLMALVAFMGVKFIAGGGIRQLGNDLHDSSLVMT
jgi:hypothetical protein